MTVTFTHRGGEMNEGREEEIADLVAELDGPVDDEHPDVAVTDDDSGWCLSAFPGGALVLENLEDGGVAPRHMPGGSRVEIVRIMRLLARGDLAGVAGLDWRQGYPGSR